MGDDDRHRDRDREDSPDWLRAFQPPSLSVTTLSSDSDLDPLPSPYGTPTRDDDDTSQDDASMSPIKSSTKKRATTQADVANKMPSKRRKTVQVKDNNDVKMEDFSDKPFRTRARNHSVLTLSSDSEPDSSAAIREEAIEEPPLHELKEDIYDQEPAPKVAKKGKSPKKQLKLGKGKLQAKKKTDTSVPIEESMKEEEKDTENGDSSSKVARKKKSPKKRSTVEDVDPADDNQRKEPIKTDGDAGDVGVVDEGLPEKHTDSRVDSTTLALVLSDKVSRSKALVECEGESIDLSGDMGAVGRVIIPETHSGEPEMFFDLKGTIYKTTIVPSRTFCVVSIGQSEAKIEAIMNDFIQLKAQSNVYDAETMVEGTLEGFSFESEDEADKTTKDVKADQNEGDEEQTGKKPKGKAEKKTGATQKKGKAAGGKQPKKRKPLATKKSRAKK